MKSSLVGKWKSVQKRLSSRRGQNTVEYLMMLAVVVVVAALAAKALKTYMPGLMSQIEGQITGAASGIGGGNGSTP
jgi:hypothetical protein